MRKHSMPFFICSLLIFSFSGVAFAGGGHDLGSELPLWSVIPFVGILLSIAIFPLVAEKFWHHHYGKISAAWALMFALPFLFIYGDLAVHEILHTYFLEYFPFIILLWALYTVSGGILVQGAPVGLPVANLVLLAIGTALASWIGTTGAAMVLIRPYLRMNQYRKSKIHLIVFFIILVANVGGSLTPLGDPPLFLGFLQGVDFFWTFNIIGQMLFVVGILLAVFMMWDTWMFRKEGWHKKMHLIDAHMETEHHGEEIVLEEEVELENPQTHKIEKKSYKMTVQGLFNFLFLGGIIVGVLFSGQFHLGEVTVFGIHMEWQNIIRDFFLIIMGVLSLIFTPQDYRKSNDFNWFPIVEVAKLFAGIFITIIPALVMLRAGEKGALKFIIDAVNEPLHYFWITGTLSSFLDNAPTYLVFFNTAIGKFSVDIAQSGLQGVEWLMSLEHGAIYLKAISCGAVFFGAMTYIGNAPNFMVKAISEQAGIKMPSFFGYMAYSVVILTPLFILTTLIFF